MAFHNLGVLLELLLKQNIGLWSFYYLFTFQYFLMVSINGQYFLSLVLKRVKITKSYVLSLVLKRVKIGKSTVVYLFLS